MRHELDSHITPEFLDERLKVLRSHEISPERYWYQLMSIFSKSLFKKSEFFLVPTDETPYVECWIGAENSDVDKPNVSLGVLFSAESLQGGLLSEGELYMLLYPHSESGKPPRLIHMPRDIKTAISPYGTEEDELSAGLGIEPKGYGEGCSIAFQQYLKGTLLVFPGMPNAKKGRKLAEDAGIL